MRIPFCLTALGLILTGCGGTDYLGQPAPVTGSGQYIPPPTSYAEPVYAEPAPYPAPINTTVLAADPVPYEAAPVYSGGYEVGTAYVQPAPAPAPAPVAIAEPVQIAAAPPQPAPPVAALPREAPVLRPAQPGPSTPRAPTLASDRGVFPAPDSTYLFYDDAHGFIVEYLSPDGSTRYWAPGAESLVQGRWRSQGRQVCFSYGAASVNLQTGEQGGGDWQCESADPGEIGLVGAIRGDAFNLTSGPTPPYVLSKCQAPEGFQLQRPASYFSNCR